MPWMILVTGAPFALALVVLQVLGPVQLPNAGFAAYTDGYLAGLITFCTAAAAQFAVCLGAVYVFAQTLRTTPAEVRRRALVVGVPFALAMLLALALMPNHGGMAGQLTFGFFAETFALSGAEWLHDGAKGGPPSRLFLAYYLPSAFGVIAVVAAAMTLAVVVKVMPRPDSSEWSAAWSQGHITIRRALYLLTLILVLSTFAASLFFHMPVELFHKTARMEVAGFAKELSIFWGTIYSLTLIATVAPAIFLLQQNARLGVAALTDPEAAADAHALLEAKSLVGGLKRQIELVLALLAPMIAGPVASAFQAVVVV